MSKKIISLLFSLLAFHAFANVSLAVGGGADSRAGGHHGDFAFTFLWIAIILLVAKLSGFVERFGQSAVLGELVVGMILGNLTLVGINFFEPIKSDQILAFLAELGVVILLFQIGLESNLGELTKLGKSSIMVAVVGVVVPFALGAYIVGPAIMPGLPSTAYLFLGAALTATSVGITARVFKDLGKLKTKEAQIVLGAAVIDDVLGLIILAVVTAIATAGTVTLSEVGIIVAKSFGFLAGSIILGQTLAPRFGGWLSKVSASVGMKFTLAMSFCLFFAFLAQQIGLAPIIGAFAGGLVLDPLYFERFHTSEVVFEVKRLLKRIENLQSSTREQIFGVLQRHHHRHVEDIIQSVSFFLVPIFFVLTGMSVDLQSIFNPSVMLIGGVITIVAFIGKIVSGMVVGKGVDKQIVGFGMVPRGEVGLIFASIGAGLGIVDQDMFSVIVIMVIITTLATPIVLTSLLNKQKA